MKRTSYFLAAALLLLITVSSAFGFDIAIYNDPLSWWNFRYQWHKRDSRYFGSYQQFLADSGYTANGAEWMSNVYGWYREMGITKVTTYYPYPDSFNDIPQDCTRIQVMNWFYPGLGTMHGDKYVDAQFRDVQVGYRKEDLEPNDPNGFWSYDTSIGTRAVRILSPLNILPDRRQCVSISGSAGMLWRPQSYLGMFSGWDWLQSGQIDSSWYMPTHFKLTWAVDGDGPIDTTQALATFHWYVRTWRDESHGYTNARWYRFPARSLILPTQAQADNWITTEFVDSANAGWYTLLDSNFVPLDSVLWDDVRFGPAHLPDALDDIHLPGVHYGNRIEVRMSVHYAGQHTFYLNRIEIYDEGAWRMFASPIANQWADSIRIGFQNEYNNSSGRSCGWYYDEWDVSGHDNGMPVLKSIARVNSILQAGGLPTIYINGYSSGNPWGRTPFRTELDNQGVQMSTHMSEFYPFGGGGHPDSAVCEPCPRRIGGSVTEFLWTSDSSDRPYLQLLPGGCDPGSYRGIKSLQCTVDEFMFGAAPLESYPGYESYLDGEGDRFMFALPEQVKYAHDSLNSPMWALVAGGSDGLGQGRSCDYPLRTPTPNEVKLTAWLALASDVDGLMWYNWEFGGFVEWSNGTFDTTANYAAGVKVCRDILRLAPTLELLTFVRTYASRAFEQDYPYAGYGATWMDTLATNVTWNEQNYRGVESIRTWAPDSNTYDGWAETEEANSYVQVSRFRNPYIPLHANVEDYWLLVVNRRALTHECRKVQIDLQVDPAPAQFPYVKYVVEYILGDSVAMRVPPPDRSGVAAIEPITLILDPGDAELVHFWRAPLNCDTVEVRVDSVTAIRRAAHMVTLRWAAVRETENEQPYTVDAYVILGSTDAERPFVPIATTPDTAWVDSVMAIQPTYFYQVEACGHVTD